MLLYHNGAKTVIGSTWRALQMRRSSSIWVLCARLLHDEKPVDESIVAGARRLGTFGKWHRLSIGADIRELRRIDVGRERRARYNLTEGSGRPSF
jgi:hypothetical protein